MQTEIVPLIERLKLMPQMRGRLAQVPIALDVGDQEDHTGYGPRTLAVSGQHNKPLVHFVANCMYGEHVAGGDIHFFNMAQATIETGHPLHFFGGHALQASIYRVPTAKKPSLTLTDSQMAGGITGSLRGQFRLLRDYFGRFMRTLSRLKEIRREDIIYAVTDYWFDTWPMMLSRARRKLMILGTDAPTIAEIVFRKRPDVTRTRLNSIYYWLSQNLSLRLFRWCRNKRLLYVHPSMKPRLLALGYREEELIFISNGVDLETVKKVPAQEKVYDVVWIGRVHQQKGIDDLLNTLSYLRQMIPNFRAVLIGKLEAELRPRIEAEGLSDCVTFAGLVSEAEKFRLFKASRVFLMPSRFESWGIVIGEALACGLPVVAYELEAYRPIFGSLVRYVQPFDFEAFKILASKTVLEARARNASLEGEELSQLKAEHSWLVARERFRRTLEAMS